MRCTLLAFVIALCTLAAGASDVGAGARLTGVGVLEQDGHRFCSAILIAPDLVATAWHCLGHGRGPHDGASMSFHTGAYPGQPSSSRDVVATFAHPIAASERGADIAVLRLAAPFSPEAATPIPPGAAPLPGERLLVAGYPGSQGARARERRCLVLGEGTLEGVLGCDVVGGESGGGVIRLAEDGPALAAVIVARARVGRQPLAVVVDAARRITQLRAIHGF